MATVLQFADGSVGTVNYFSSGSKSYPKETLEILGDGRVLRMENSRATCSYGFAGFKKDIGDRHAFEILMQRHAHGEYANCATRRFSRVGLRGDRFCQLKFFDQGSIKYIASVYI